MRLLLIQRVDRECRLHSETAVATHRWTVTPVMFVKCVFGWKEYIGVVAQAYINNHPPDSLYSIKVISVI